MKSAGEMSISELTAEVQRIERWRYDALRAVLADRERELLELKGPCSTKTCRLHCAHSGPCDIVKENAQ